MVAVHSGILMDEMQTGHVESACVHVFLHMRVCVCV